jgi:inosine/xanthosine triphosphate pyrophosphatase family protein
MNVILASSNSDKLKQLSIYFEDLGLSLIMPEEKIIIEEDQPTLQANAEKKALAYSQKYPGQFVIATDGGAKIPYLGDNWNHVLTHRLSGLDAGQALTERERCEMLLEMLKNAHGADRRVSWHEAYAVAKGGQIIFSEEISGVDESTLLDHIPPDFQEDGFWIGYLWYEPEFGKHYMALTDEEKKSLNNTTAVFVNLLKERKIFS